MLFIIKRGRCKTEDCHSKAHYAEVAMAIRISDGMFTNNGGGAKEFANIDFPELGKEYPELYILKSATSSYSLYARYLKNFELYNICVGYKKKIIDLKLYVGSFAKPFF